MLRIDEIYESRMNALRPLDRVARSVSMLNWSRELIARQIILASGNMSTERLKWEVALRMYGADPKSREVIQRQIDHVSG